jgi:hypothetical protein
MVKRAEDRGATVKPKSAIVFFKLWSVETLYPWCSATVAIVAIVYKLIKIDIKIYLLSADSICFSQIRKKSQKTLPTVATMALDLISITYNAIVFFKLWRNYANCGATVVSRGFKLCQ